MKWNEKLEKEKKQHRPLSVDGLKGSQNAHKHTRTGTHDRVLKHTRIQAHAMAQQL